MKSTLKRIIRKMAPFAFLDLKAIEELQKGVTVVTSVACGRKSEDYNSIFFYSKD
jgi:hypothetical protein